MTSPLVSLTNHLSLTSRPDSQPVPGERIAAGILMIPDYPNFEPRQPGPRRMTFYSIQAPSKTWKKYVEKVQHQSPRRNNPLAQCRLSPQEAPLPPPGVCDPQQPKYHGSPAQLIPPSHCTLYVAPLVSSNQADRRHRGTVIPGTVTTLAEAVVVRRVKVRLLLCEVFTKLKSGKHHLKRLCCLKPCRRLIMQYYWIMPRIARGLWMHMEMRAHY